MLLEVQTLSYIIFGARFVIPQINQNGVLSLPRWGTQEIPQNEATM